MDDIFAPRSNWLAPEEMAASGDSAGATARPADGGDKVAGMLAQLSQVAGLRELLPANAVLLPPIPLLRGNRRSLLALYVAPGTAEDAARLARGWAVELAWPQGKVIRSTDLSWDEDLQVALAGVVSTAPRAKDNIRLHKLYAALANLLDQQASDAADLAALAPHYAALLPAAAYICYGAVAPEAQLWLQPIMPPATPQPQEAARVAELPDAAAQAAPLVAASAQSAAPAGDAPAPSDLTPRLSGWFERGLAVARAAEATASVHSMQALAGYSRMPGCRVVVVGQATRGKSTLINQVLGRALLPTGVVPTTANQIAISAAPVDRLELRFADGHSETRPLEAAAWRDLQFDPHKSNQEVSPARLRLLVNNAWLQEQDIEIFDTPGLSEKDEERSAQLAELLNRCDVILLVLGAPAAFSLTEATFLQQQMLRDQAARVLVVVTRLDKVPAAERSEVFADTRARIAAVAAAVTVLPSFPIEAGQPEEEAIATIRTQLAAMVEQTQRRAWRSHQVASRLNNILADLITLADTSQEAARMTGAERDTALHAAQAELKSTELDWQRLQSEFEERRLRAAGRVRDRLLHARQETARALNFNLESSGNPKHFWESVLPFYLQRDLANANRAAEGLILDAVTKDFAWLQERVARLAGRRMAQPLFSAAADATTPLQIENLQLKDVERQRLFTRLGTGAAMLAGAVILWPLGLLPLNVATGTIAGVTADQFMTTRLNEQRQLVQRDMIRILDREIDSSAARVNGRLRELYDHLFQELKRENAAWYAARLSALAGNGSGGGDNGRWLRSSADATSLRQEIIAALQAPVGANVTSQES